MSARLTGEVIHDPEIKDVRTFAVLLCLADDAQKETNSTSSSINEISRMAKCSRRTAIRVMVDLEKKGWIKVIRRTDDKGSSLPNLYTILKYGPPVAAQYPPSATSYDIPSAKVTPPSATQSSPSAKPAFCLVTERHSPSAITPPSSPAPSISPSLPLASPSSLPLTPSSLSSTCGDEDFELLGEQIMKSIQTSKPKKKKQSQNLSKDELISSLQDIYPMVDVAAEYRSASRWILLHPNRKFTQRFFGGWVDRQSKDGGSVILPLEKPRPGSALSNC